MNHNYSYIFFSLVYFNLIGQTQKEVYKHATFWHKTEINEFFDDNWGVGVDYVYRSKSTFDGNNMFESHLRSSIRPWIHYQFTPNSRASISPLGYMYTNEYVADEDDLLRPSYYELRTTFQFFHHYKHLDGKLMHTWRYRQELRWQEQDGVDDFRFLARFRFRYRLRYMINTNSFYENNTLYAAVSNEIGLNFGKSVVYNTFNPNRLYVGLGYRFLNSARVELRYVNRIRTRGATGYEFDNGRGLMLGVYIDQISGLGKANDNKVRFSD